MLELRHYLRLNISSNLILKANIIVFDFHQEIRGEFLFSATNEIHAVIFLPKRC